MFRFLTFFFLVALSGKGLALTDQCAFLLSILAEPSDEVALLVFADWLDEHDDPLAALIRIQMQRNKISRVNARDPQLSALGVEREWAAGIGNWLRIAGEIPDVQNPFRVAEKEFVSMGIPPSGLEVCLGSPKKERHYKGVPTTEYDTGPLGKYTDEKRRWVVLTQPIEMQRTPITQYQWAMVMGNNPSRFTDLGFLRTGDHAIDPHRPVDNVSWDDAQAFILKLNSLDSRYLYRLPTEAEWEFAARAGSSAAFCYGSSCAELSNYGFYHSNSQGRTHWVRSLKPNAFGLYDMHGNIWEWTEDWYMANPPGTGLINLSYPRDPLVRRYHNSHVVRGGYYNSTSITLRSAYRDYQTSNTRENMGFRLVRTLK